MHDIHQLEDIYGPAAVFFEHKLGDRITYSLGKEIFTGEIVWCTAPQVLKRKQSPVLYIVERDNAGHAFPDMVRPGRVLISGS